MADDSKPKLIPIAATGELLGGVSRSMVYELVAEGRLTKVNIGTRSFVTAESLDSYVESLIRPPEAAACD